MSIDLSKGQKISLVKTNGSTLMNFCVGLNWGSIQTSGGFLGLGKKVIDVDLDLSCILINEKKEMLDYIYSPFYRVEMLKRFGLEKGKLETVDKALKHSGDDLSGDTGGDDGLDNEIITVDLARVNKDVKQIFFFLNNVGKEDFSQIPFAKLRMYEGTPTKVNETFASYNVSSEEKFKNRKALIMGKLEKVADKWNFVAIGEPTEDSFIGETIQRILKSY